MSIEIRKTIELAPTKEGFYRVDPLPSEEDLAEYYQETYYKEDRATYKHEYTDKEIAAFFKKVNRRIRTIKHLFPWEPSTCLDIGCGEGWALRAFHDAGWEVAGLDYTTYSCSIHNPEFVDKIIPGNLYDSLARLIDEGAKYQVLHMDSILEHVVDPYKLLEQCRQVIEPDGVLVIEVPNSISGHYRYLHANGIIGGAIGCVAYPDHLSYFGAESLRNICDIYGFKEVAIVDFTIYGMKINNKSALFDEYIDTCPFDKALRYYTAMADLGLGGEVLGFFGADS